MKSLYESILGSTKSGLSALPIQFSRIYTSNEFDDLITDYCNIFNIDNSEYIVKVLEHYCNNLKKLEIPSGIKSLTGSLYDGIEEYSLDYIYIPDTVESFSSPRAIFVFYESDEIPEVIPNTPYYTDVSIDEFRDTIKNIVKIDYIYYLLNDTTFTAKALLNVDVESDIIIPEKISNNNVLYNFYGHRAF